MLWNYFKISLKVLKRRKFFTFISLFGISLTLMILTLVITFLQNELGNNYPLTEKDNMVFAFRLHKIRIEQDTIYKKDTTYQAGIMKVDSTLSVKDKQTGMSISQMSFKTINEHLSKAKNAINQSLFIPREQFACYRNDKKLAYDGSYTDKAYWDIFDFKFLEGQAYQNPQIENREPVAVISEKLKKEYFGSQTNVLGQSVEFGQKEYKVIGVIEDVKCSHDFVKSDIYVPYTLAHEDHFKSDKLLGSFNAVYLTKDDHQKQALIDELAHLGSQLPMPAKDHYNKTELIPLTFFENYAQEMMYSYKKEKSVRKLVMTLAILLSLFILLPTLNLININSTRIIERASEIGVRKAFGANTNNLILQFLFENIVLTMIGAIIGIGLSIIAIYFFNSLNIIADTQLKFNLPVFLYSLLVCLFFGILSGAIPAWKMSRLAIVNALKNKIND